MSEARSFLALIARDDIWHDERKQQSAITGMHHLFYLLSDEDRERAEPIFYLCMMEYCNRKELHEKESRMGYCR